MTTEAPEGALSSITEPGQADREELPERLGRRGIWAMSIGPMVGIVLTAGLFLGVAFCSRNDAAHTGDRFVKAIVEGESRQAHRYPWDRLSVQQQNTLVVEFWDALLQHAPVTNWVRGSISPSDTDPKELTYYLTTEDDALLYARVTLVLDGRRWWVVGTDMGQPPTKEAVGDSRAAHLAHLRAHQSELFGTLFVGLIGLIFVLNLAARLEWMPHALISCALTFVMLSVAYFGYQRQKLEEQAQPLQLEADRLERHRVRQRLLEEKADREVEPRH